MVRRNGVTFLAATILVAASAIEAQDIGRRCQTIDVENRGDSTRVAFVQQPTGTVTYAGGGVTVLCRTEGIRLVADSAEHHEASEIVYLFGRVRYTEGTTAVDARRITYWKRDERILAEGDVVARLGNGTTMTGPRADYLRAVPGLRPRAQLRATDRPHITLVRIDSAAVAGGGAAGAPPAPTRPPARGAAGRGAPAVAATPRGPGRPTLQPDTTIVDANTVFMDGDSLIYASGKVVVTRSDLVATSDSLALNRALERARFIGTPVMKGSGERSFTMTGSVIDIFSRERKLERVISRDAATVMSDEIELRADTIDLRIREDLLERAYAFGPSRARAISPAQDMTADSIEIYMPGQRIREVHAVGKAVAESEPDSTRITSSERDWIRGDTIIAVFDSIAPKDTTTKARIRELRSIVSASSFYQIPPDDSTVRCPKINYSRGHRITVLFDSQTVQRVSVVDSVTADGLYLECAPPGAAGPPAGAARAPAPGPTRNPAPPSRAPTSSRPVTPPPTTGRPPE